MHVHCKCKEHLFTPPARSAWRSYKFASLDFSGVFFSVSQVGLPLMGDTAVHCCLSHDFWTQFLAEYVAKTHNLTCILQHLSSKKVVRAKIRIQNVLWRQIPPQSLRQGRWIAVMYMSWESHMQRSIRIQFVNILILFDVTDYRLLYGNCSISFSPRSDKITWQSRDPWRLQGKKIYI